MLRRKLIMSTLRPKKIKSADFDAAFEKGDVTKYLKTESVKVAHLVTEGANLKKSLAQWLSYIESLHHKTIELGLERVALVAQKLQVTTFDCPVITVAGTNGKGSCVAFLESIFSAAGLTAGAYTSPHLLRFNERIRIADQVVDDASLLQAFERVEAAREEITLTYFEFTTLAAFVLFKAAKLDVLVLEVGLGGRLDAVNIIDPDIAVVTKIALDHTDWLGDTREAIGYEKAGIFRAKKPAICGDTDPPASILQTACRLSAALYLTGVDFDCEIQPPKSWAWRYQETVYTHLPLPHLPLPSASTALMAVHLLQDRLPVSVPAILQGLRQASLAGRFQRFNYPIETILDVAHNPDSAHYLAKRLGELPVSGKTYAVVGMLSDKDIEETLRPMLPLVNIWYVATLELPRGSTTKNMANCLEKLGVNAYDIRLAESVAAAYEKAVKDADSSDRIVVFGSFHTVGPILNYLYTVSE
jgi:dihydrofolate synthase/folylpolyglutamate synthase